MSNLRLIGIIAGILLFVFSFVINAAKDGFRIHEAPINILKRKHGKSKKDRNWRYGFNFTKIVIRSWWRPV